MSDLFDFGTNTVMDPNKETVTTLTNLFAFFYNVISFFTSGMKDPENFLGYLMSLLGNMDT